MKLLRTTLGKVVLMGASLVVIAFGWKVARDLYWRTHPDVAFRAITGRELPAGVRAQKYGHEMNDNLFHTTHYWLLDGSPSALRQVTNGTGFVESEDARWMMPDLHRMFGSEVVTTQVVAGYEWELGRDRWYCILAGETTACYAH
ncbi:MAG: hypothetical protein HC841_08600 [Verrucomicrobiae bacterium]|nr:hypothetical protein [Verrucomicrobiae bacterium]